MGPTDVHLESRTRSQGGIAGDIEATKTGIAARANSKDAALGVVATDGGQDTIGYVQSACVVEGVAIPAADADAMPGGSDI